MLIDTHCHLNFDAFDSDRSEALSRAGEADVQQIIIPAVDPETARQAISLAEASAMVFAAVGVHPNDASEFSTDQLSEINAMAAHPRVVAIGEIGLDYYWDKSPRATQLSALEQQLELAARMKLPVIIHNRESTGDVLAVLESWSASLTGSLRENPGVMHSFSGNLEDAERAMRAGFCIGFTGPITYKSAEETRRIASSIPIDRILIETDAPFLTPIPYRGKRNEPAYVRFVAERLASVRSLSFDDVATATTQNARRVFNLPSVQSESKTPRSG